MTDAQIIAYYANLLILQYLGQPNAYATIQALVTPVIMGQLPLLAQNAFDIDTAIGSQLDILGKYAGVTRSGADTNGNSITLTDSEFRTFIRMATVSNSAGSDLNTIQNFLFMFFPDEIQVYDSQNMLMTYFINPSIGDTNILQLFITEGLLPKPMGVGLAIVVTSLSDYFGMVSASVVNAYMVQNSVSLATAVAAVTTNLGILPFNDTTAPATGPWLSASGA
jgi:hypothetical protein